MRKFFKVFSIIILSLVTIVSCSSTTDESSTKDVLRVGMELQFPPFETINEDGEPYGLSVDFAQYLADKMDMDLEIVNTAFSGLIPSLQSGKIDMILSSMTITDQRLEVIDFTDPYAVSNLAALIYKDSPINSASEANQEGVKVAVKKGTTGHIYAEENLPNAEILLFDKESSAILETSQGKVDMFIYGQDSVYQSNKEFSDTTRINLEPIGEPQFWGIGVKKGNTELLNKLNLYIKEFNDNNGFEKLSETYLGELKSVFEELNLQFFFDVDQNK